MEIQYSRIKVYRECRQKHYYKYIQHLEPRRPAIPLFRGTIIHACLEGIAVGKDWRDVLEGFREEYDRLFEEEKEVNLIEDIYRILEGYEEFWEDDPLKFHLVEHQLRNIPLTRGIDFKAKIDALVEDKQGLFWLREIKSHKVFPSEDVRLMDLQTVLYVWALRKSGFRVDGILWDYIRTKPPTIPEVLKNGSLTRRKNIDTTAAVYLKTIEENGLDPKDYQDVLERLEGREAAFYKRVRIPVKNSTIKTILRDAKATGREMALLQNYPVRTLGRHCEWCDFQSLCYAELRGLDTEFVLNAEYQVREEDEYGEAPENHEEED